MRYIVKLFAFGFFLLSSSISVAQTSREELSAVKEKAGGNYYAYPTPSGKLTPAPDGYIPFYISHYGRHGSRNMIDAIDSKEAREFLRQAESDGKLTKLGKKTLLYLDTIIDNMDERYGELTQVGHNQHRNIAKRMFNAYPQIFSDAISVDARSTQVHRCILSMGAFCQELKSLNPKLKITNNASQRDMFFMCNDIHLGAHKASDNQVRWHKMYNAFCEQNNHPERLMSVLFTNPNYLKADKAKSLSRKLFNVASDIQDMDGIGFSLFPLFTDEELFDYWQSQNAFWFGWLGLQADQDTREYEMAGNLLRDILDKAAAAISSSQPSATLRFGHDTGILPLLALMHVNNAYCRVSDLNELYKKWADYKLIPMAANIQFVFYRNASGNVLVKVLLNEEEASLPLKTAGPYYQWTDFQDYYEDVLSHIPNVRSSVGNK